MDKQRRAGGGRQGAWWTTFTPSGRNTVMGDEELEIMVRDADPERYERLLFHKSR